MKIGYFHNNVIPHQRAHPPVIPKRSEESKAYLGRRVLDSSHTLGMTGGVHRNDRGLFKAQFTVIPHQRAHPNVNPDQARPPPVIPHQRAHPPVIPHQRAHPPVIPKRSELPPPGI